jgi:hypothetical protein
MEAPSIGCPCHLGVNLDAVLDTAGYLVQRPLVTNAAGCCRYGLLCRAMAEEMGESMANTLLTAPSRPTFLQIDEFTAITLKYFNRVVHSDESSETDPVARDSAVNTLSSCWFRGIVHLETNLLVTVGSMEIYAAGSRRLGGNGGGKIAISDARILKSLDAVEFFAGMCVSVVELNFSLIEEIGERMDDAEVDILEELPRMHLYAEGDLTMSVARDVHVLKRELFLIRRAFWPCREALSTMLSSQKERLRGAGPQQLVKQAYDYSVNLIDNAETLRELGTNLVELYSAQLSLVPSLCSNLLPPCAPPREQRTNLTRRAVAAVPTGNGETNEDPCHG